VDTIEPHATNCETSTTGSKFTGGRAIVKSAAGPFAKLHLAAKGKSGEVQYHWTKGLLKPLFSRNKIGRGVAEPGVDPVGAKEKRGGHHIFESDETERQTKCGVPVAFPPVNSSSASLLRVSVLYLNTSTHMEAVPLEAHE
jgi:hypothetical protein